MSVTTGLPVAASRGPGKVTDESALLDCLKDGMRLGIGGFGLDRKPMSLVRAIVRSPIRDLTVETYAGGFDIEALVSAGKLRGVASCHVGLDHFGLAPMFRAARQGGSIAFEEWSELTQLVAWRAAAEGVGFATTRLDRRTDLLRVNPNIRVAPSVFGGDEVVVKAPSIDVAILHAEAAHPDGWAIAAGDRYLDALLARAARTVILTTERLIDECELEARYRDVHLLASYVDVVIVAPQGALPGSCIPEYVIDLPAVRGYVDLCAGPDAAPERVLAAIFGAQGRSTP